MISMGISKQGDAFITTVIFIQPHVEVPINGGTPNGWLVDIGKSICKWIICGYPYFRKPPKIGGITIPKRVVYGIVLPTLIWW